MNHHQADAPPSQEDETRTWVIYVPSDFLDVPMSDKARTMLLKLESMARTRVYCIPSNEYLAAAAGKRPRAIQRVLEELEASGWITRVYVDQARGHRVGIIFRRRIDPKMPHVETAEEISLAAAEILGRHKRHASLPSVSFSPPELPCLNVFNSQTACQTSSSSSIEDGFTVAAAPPLVVDSPEGLQEQRETTSPTGETDVKGGGAGEPVLDYDAEQAARAFAGVVERTDAIEAWSGDHQGLYDAIDALARDVAFAANDDHSVSCWAGILWNIRRCRISKAAFLEHAWTIYDPTYNGIECPAAFVVSKLRGPSIDERLEWEARHQKRSKRRTA